MEYKKGVENKVADALSCKNETKEDKFEDQRCRTTSVIEPTWLSEVRDMVTHSPFFKELQSKANEGTHPPTKYKKISEIWFYKGRAL